MIGTRMFGLPIFKKEWSLKGVKDKKKRQEIIDKRTHMLATILASFPLVSTKRLAQELGISADLIRQLAHIFGVKKSREYRSEAYKNNDNAPKRKVVKMSPDGKVVKTYDSIKDAAEDNKCDRNTIIRRCEIGRVIKGYKYKLEDEKKNKN